jgi:hypothetical protein
MENMMLKTINFHYSIISHFREQYLKLFPRIQKLYEADYPAMFNYSTTQFIPAFGSNVTCTLYTNYNDAEVVFQGQRLYKGSSELLVRLSTHEEQTDQFSNYNGRSLNVFPKSSNPYHFAKTNTPTKIFEMLHENDPDELEVMEFMLMTKYNMNDLTAILLNQVLINEDVGIQKYIMNIVPFVGIDPEREKGLLDLYFSTAIGLEHEAAKAG